MFQNSGNLAPGDPYLNFLLSSLVEIPGYTLSYVCMEKLGRRLSVCITLCICGIACIADALLDEFANMESSFIKDLDIAIFLIGMINYIKQHVLEKKIKQII